MQHRDWRRIAGWLAVGFSTLIACIWAFWGISETFHEGWYYPSLLWNVGLMFAQYLSPMLVFMGVTLVSLYWPRLGTVLHLSLALLAVWFFQAFTNAATFLLILPLVGLGLLYWFGRPRPRRLAVSARHALAQPARRVLQHRGRPCVVARCARATFRRRPMRARRLDGAVCRACRQVTERGQTPFRQGPGQRGRLGGILTPCAAP